MVAPSFLKARVVDKRSQSGINMVDLMMWLVIAALLLSAAIQGIGYYQKAAALETLKNNAIGFGANALAVAAANQGIVDASVADEGAANTKWNSGVTHDVVVPQSGGKPYLLVNSPAVNDITVVYMFESCGGLDVGVNVIPKTSVSSFGACLTNSSVAPPPAPTVVLDGWGQNASGQLGNGTLTNSNFPVSPITSGALAGKTVTSASGGRNSCVVASGAAYCWGTGNFGGLGNGASVNSNVPVAVNTSGVLAGKTVTYVVSGGSNNACALAGAEMYCWGYNAFGQLGNGTTTTSNIPVSVSMSGSLSGKSITKIAMGQYNTCVIASGAPYCWGNNSWGQLGIGYSGSSATTPSAVKMNGALSGKTVTDISVGSRNVCAVASGAAYCWGDNSSGQLGVGDTTEYAAPVAVNVAGVLGGKTVTSVSSGIIHSCAVASGAAYCWGDNSSGQLGNNSTVASLTPVAVNTSSVLSNKVIAKTSSNDNASCVTTLDAVYCWGNGTFGQLGNGVSSSSSVPVAVSTGLLTGRTINGISGSGNTFLLMHTG